MNLLQKELNVIKNQQLRNTLITKLKNMICCKKSVVNKLLQQQGTSEAEMDKFRKSFAGSIFLSYDQTISTEQQIRDLSQHS